MKHYLIDSENVGDFWIPLLDLPADQAELIVFYTKNSPHMSYESLIKLKESDRKVTFIKCYEGTNALDFQLCSELGYLIATNEGDDFIIVTNDTGYDAAVKYWRRKEYSVKRIAGKDARTGSRRRGNAVRSDVAAEVSSILNKLNQTADQDEAYEEEEIVGDAPQLDGAEEGSGDEIYGSDYERSDYEGSDDEDSGSEEYEDEESDESGENDPEYEDPDSEDSDSYEDSDSEDAEYEESDEDDPVEEDSDDADLEEDVPYEEEPDNETGYEEYEETSYEGSDNDESDGSMPLENGAESEEETEQDDQEDESETDGDGPDRDDSGEAGTPAAGDRDPVAQEESKEEFRPDPDELTAIVNCIGMENLAELHNQLIQFYGENGKDIYKARKTLFSSIENKNWTKEEKFLYYCVLILRHSDEPEEALQEENVRELAQFLLGAENKRKNLNSLRYALLKHYGKEKGRRYYFMLKPYVKALNQM